MMRVIGVEDDKNDGDDDNENDDGNCSLDDDVFLCDYESTTMTTMMTLMTIMTMSLPPTRPRVSSPFQHRRRPTRQPPLQAPCK